MVSPRPAAAKEASSSKEPDPTAASRVTRLVLQLGAQQTHRLERALRAVERGGSLLGIAIRALARARRALARGRGPRRG